MRTIKTAMSQFQLTVCVCVLATTVLTACTTTPTSIVQQPTSARPAAPIVATAASGAIFQAASYRSLFEDRRARFVGDILTVTINEKTNAGKQASSNASKTGSVDTSITGISGVSKIALLGKLNGLNVGAASSNKYDDKSATNSSNLFNGSVTVTIIEVLSNGNLVVSGEKQVALDKGTEFVRLSGTVAPDTIQAGNTVSSAQIADARIEYRTGSNIDSAEVMGWMARFFLSFAPL
jgi:flagellar L-ring protein precursor FlgH